MAKERFTMLLSEPGEIFFEDYSVQMRRPDASSEENKKWIDGRLKLCSKSLVFVNKDINQPLIKIQFKETVSTEQYTSTNEAGDILSVKCKQYVEMLEKNILAPYRFVHQNSMFHFCFNYTRIEDCLPQILQLHRAASLPNAEQNAMIMAIVHSRQSGVSFDMSWLEDLYEQVVLETQANQILPLVINPGRVLLTTARIYFQPYNNTDQHPVLKIQLKDIRSIIKRRFILRQVGLEIKWIRTSGRSEYLFLSFQNQDKRDKLYEELLKQSAVSLETVPQNQMLLRWRNGYLSNYDYILYINSLADRTFHDLTQYPVFPWVIQDYTSTILDLSDTNVYRDLSKPIGALNPTRLERLKERYSEMSDPKFLYGSHYSAPGFVLFYLVRKYPQYMLCLQNGRFDHPDRMFNSIADVWKNVLVNMSDFKELIPEFYDTSNGGDFLVNSYGIDFGHRHDGTKINDVQLAPWAESPSDFIKKLRDALESEYVSQNLHHWIDLIFGHKQRGVEAEKADNVFFHLCYEGAVDLDTVRDINDRHGLEVQIMEFGQIPKQVFTLPHPKRLTSTVNLPHSAALLSSPEITSEGNTCAKEKFNFTESVAFQAHKGYVSSVVQKNTSSCNEIISVGQDGMLKLYNISEKKVTRSVKLSSLSLSSCISYYTPSQRNILVAGSWDNTLIFYDIEFGRVIDVLQGHTDAVSCLAWSPARQIIVSGSWDCTAKVWRGYTSGTKIKPAEYFIAQLDHDSKVTCVDISRDDATLVSGTEDGELCLWNMDTYDLQYIIKGHMCKVNAVTFDKQCSSVISCAEDGVLNVTDVRTSTQIYSVSLENEPLTVTWMGPYLLIGDDDGNVNIWDYRKTVFVTRVHCHDDGVRVESNEPFPAQCETCGRVARGVVGRDVMSENALRIFDPIVGSDLKEQRVCIRFCYNLGMNASKTHETLRDAFGEYAMSRTQVYTWFSKFKNGVMSTEDAKRTGRPTTIKTDTNLNRVKELIRSDNSLSVREISEKLNISLGSVQRILNDLNLRAAERSVILCSIEEMIVDTEPCVVVTNSTEQVWSQLEIHVIKPRIETGLSYKGSLSTLAVTPDSNLVITGSKDKKVIVWEYHN